MRSHEPSRHRLQRACFIVGTQAGRLTRGSTSQLPLPPVTHQSTHLKPPACHPPPQRRQRPPAGARAPAPPAPPPGHPSSRRQPPRHRRRRRRQTCRCAASDPPCRGWAAEQAPAYAVSVQAVHRYLEQELPGCRVDLKQELPGLPSGIRIPSPPPPLHTTPTPTPTHLPPSTLSTRPTTRRPGGNASAGWSTKPSDSWLSLQAVVHSQYALLTHSMAITCCAPCSPSCPYSHIPHTPYPARPPT